MYPSFVKGERRGAIWDIQIPSASAATRPFEDFFGLSLRDLSVRSLESMNPSLEVNVFPLDQIPLKCIVGLPREPLVFSDKISDVAKRVLVDLGEIHRDLTWIGPLIKY